MRTAQTTEPDWKAVGRTKLQPSTENVRVN